MLRFGTLFGLAPRVRFDALVNRVAYLAGVGRPLTIYGNGKQRRPSMHVDDATRLIVEMLNNPAEPDTILNAAVHNPSVEDVRDAVLAAKPDSRFRYTEQDVLSYLSPEVDSSRLFGYGFEPSHSLVDGIAELLDHFTGFAPMLYGAQSVRS